jgi:aldose 1-epimerase
MVAAVVGLCSCQTVTNLLGADKNVTVKSFGETPGGEEVELYTLCNANGMKAEIMTYGAIVVSLEVPDRDGNPGDIVQGYDNLDGYIENNPYFGAIVGRYGNRIARGRFTIDGTEYTLATNDGDNHLHGGNVGFDKVVWDAKPVKRSDGPALELVYMSPDGDEGYPGNLMAKVTYVVTNDNELLVEYEATTDKPTVVNLTHHGYWNLSACERDILGHELMINANTFTPVDSGLIPTGQLTPVEGTPMDFRTPTAIGARVNADYEQLRFGGGYDHNWVLKRDGEGMALAATLYDEPSGRYMEIWTEEPAIQFYCGNFLDGTITGKGGKVYGHRSGLCLETQHYPDSPNHANFPSTALRPGEVYTTKTVHRFSVR